ncbi:c-type cytochrome (plasmid) [Falsirhodobacter algicola]|uniref:C-type cytochrome n=2 Tax=Falsirhodobacter algicola TaxID=2692330 RepID=A0A8J8MVE3_9RHOB|nr:c-type cytochrome [Falsirhodobacter algicola]
MKRILLTLLVAVVLIGAAVLAWGLWPTSTREIDASAFDLEDPELIADGEYLMHASDCVACHAPKAADSFTGGLPIATPIGAIYSTNITPDKDTGIGDYSLNDFDRALRHGIRPDGATIYPAMPWPAYARMTDHDIAALYAYFMHGVAPMQAENRAPDIAWPMNMRWPLAFWRKAFGPGADAVFDPSRFDDDVVARGAYLVEGPGHCGTCHTPRAATLQEVALDDRGDGFLAGGAAVDGYIPYNLRGDEGSGLGLWSEEDIARTLSTARNAHAAVIGPPMQDVVAHSLQYLTPEDITAIARYLKTLSPAGDQAARFTPGDTATASALARGETSSRGGEVFLDSCAACHFSAGTGTTDAIPGLAGNPTVLTEDPSSLIRLILTGDTLPRTEERPNTLGMPRFDWRLDDDEVAEVLTFIRTGWGNDAPEVTAEEVAEVRAHLKDDTETADQR